MTIEEIERLRQQLQEKIDASKDIESRRAMGQFSTPHVLSRQIVSETLPYLKGRGRTLRMLETSMGIGSFVASTMMVMAGRIKEICGYELDADFYNAAVKIWDGQPVKVIRGDFTKATSAKGCEVEVWRILADIPPSDIKACGRSYGGGLYKVEPKELANVPCGALSGWIREHS